MTVWYEFAKLQSVIPRQISVNTRKKRFIPLVTLDSSEMWNGTNWMAGPVLPSLSVRPCIGDRGNGKVFIHIGTIWDGGTVCKRMNLV